jgi:general secretion pathway protein F
MRAGETSGRLADALDMAGASFGRSAALRSRMGSALIYPSFVIVATLVTLSLFMLLVVPTIAQAFDGAEDRLPPSTRSLLALSHWLQQNGLYLALGVVVALAICITNTDVKRLVGQSVDAALASPLALGVVQRLEYAAFSSLAALSLEAGVPSAAAFEAAAAGVRNEPIRRKLESAVRAIRTGERPSHAVERYASPPRSFSRLMLVGEETGRMPQALKQAGELLSNEAEQRLERLGAIAGPIVTLGLGGLVASVVASLFLGLLSLSDFATS